MRPFAAFALFLALLSFPGISLLPAQSQPFHLYSFDRGLHSLSIQCLGQDPSAALWAGTANGIFRFDGRQFERYSTENGLPGNSVFALAAFRDLLWVGTPAGLAVWDGFEFSLPLLQGDAMDRTSVFDLRVEGDRLLAGTNMGVAEIRPASLEGKAWTVRRFGKNTGEVQALRIGPDGDLWTISTRGVYRIQGPSFDSPAGKYEIPDPFGFRGPLGLEITADGSVWVRTDPRLWQLPKGEERFLPGMTIPQRTNYRAPLFRTPEGDLAVPYASGVLFRHQGGWSALTESKGLPGGFASCLHWDHESNLWIGLRASGLARGIGQERWLSWTTADGLPHSTIHAITRDKAGSLWVATGRGLVQIDRNGKVSRPVDSQIGLPDDEIRSLAVDLAGFLWIGFRNMGLYRFLPSAKGPATPVDSLRGLGDSQIVGIHVYPDGAVWVCTRKGLFLSRNFSENGRFELFPLPGTNPALPSYDMTFDTRGTLWVGSPSGLYRFTDGQWRRFTTEDGLLHNSIVFLESGRDGELWIGYGNILGVGRVRPQEDSLRIEHFTAKNGLSSVDLSILCYDARGWLWVGTEQGLDVYDTGRWYHFGISNGLVWPDTAWNAFHTDPDGTVWIGTNRGLSRFKPGDELDRYPTPGVWIHNAHFGGRKVTVGKPAIRWAERTLAVEFAPATFRYESKGICRFRFPATDPMWTIAASRQQTFGNLGIGEHILEIQASIDRLHWTDPPARFSFRVLPPWWLAWWIWLTLAAGAAGLVRGAWMWRNRRLLQKHKELESLIEERSRLIAEQRQSLERERKTADRAQRTAEESDRRFRSLLETVRLATLMLDREGRVTFCNDYLVGLTGWKREEILGQVWVERFLPAEERDAHRRAFAEAMTGRDSAAFYESSLLTRSGKKRIIQWNHALLRDSEGQILGTASVGFDLTDHRAMEEEYRQVQKMESIGRLAGGVAHDFNNLLTVINGYTELLLDRIRESDSRKAIEQIHIAGDRAAGLTRQLLSFSRRQVVALQPLDLNREISESETMIRRMVGENIRVSTDCQPGLDLVLADSGQIQQILINLAANARDAMAQGGQLTMQTRNVTLEAGDPDHRPSMPPGPYVLLSVSDNGRGMDAETRARIFEPFFTTKGKGSGTGLGLATVYGIVRQSKGWIWVTSEPGQGSIFRIYLPRVEACRVETAPTHGLPVHLPSQGSETILVVEDEEAVRQFISSTLEARGYRLITASSGEEALALLPTLTVTMDLILTDVIMPGMTGREMVERLQRQYPDCHALFISGYPEEAISHQGVLDPGVSYLPKPFTAATLASKVREVLDRKGRANDLP